MVSDCKVQSKVIKGFPSYLIYDDGRVYSKKRKRFLKPRTNRDGYLSMTLYLNNKPNYKTIHRLVALAFIENPHNYRTVDHIDGNKLNNYVSNLRWASYSNQLRNRKKFKGCSSQYIGVRWNKQKQRWQVECRGINGKKIFLGLFIDEIKAAKAYDKYVIKNKISAKLNFPRNDEEKHVYIPSRSHQD